MAPFLREVNSSKFQQWTSLPCGVSSWLCLQLFLHLLFIQSGTLVVVMGLRLESISVPQSGIRGSSVMLDCEFRLDEPKDKLYSLKWYKDNHEFFRYMPQSPSQVQVQTFKLPGVQVDSDDYTTITPSRVAFKLKNLRLSSGGAYKCEISADAPTFKTLSNESILSVIAIPDPPMPRLKSFPSEMHLGGRIRGNCTFPKSYPAAQLTFYVNGVKVNNSENMKVTTYESRVDGVIEDYLSSSSSGGSSSSNGIGKQYQYQQQHQQISSSSPRRDSGVSSSMSLGGGVGSGGMVVGSVPTKENTYTSVTGIDFRLDRQYFRDVQRGQLLTIRCVATVVDRMWDTQTNITIQNLQPPKLSSTGQNRYASGSVLPNFASQTARLGLLTIMWIILSC